MPKTKLLLRIVFEDLTKILDLPPGIKITYARVNNPAENLELLVESELEGVRYYWPKGGEVAILTVGDVEELRKNIFVD